MEGINKKYEIEIEILTPLSIGAGTEKDWVRGIDFVVEDGKIYKLNIKKIAKAGVDLNLNLLANYFANKNEGGIINLITREKLESVSDDVITLPCDSQNDVKAFVKNQLNGKPILAGSSLKGAIRSILFTYLRSNETEEKDVFGSSTDGDEFMRFIKISDSEFEKTNLVNTKIFNLRQSDGQWLGGWKHSRNQTKDDFRPTGFNTLYESLMPGETGDATIMMSVDAFDALGRHRIHDKKRHILNNEITTLFEIINDHTKVYLEKEKKFFQTYSAENSGKILDSIKKLLDQIPEDNSYCILKMSAGSGFHSITGDWQFIDYSINGLDTHRHVSRGMYNGNLSSKSRKIAIQNDSFDLMGFVKLSLLTEEAKKQREEKREQERKNKEAKIAAQKADRQRDKEEQARIEQEKAEKEKQYTTLISKAKALCEDEKWEESLTKYKEAKALKPESDKHDSEIRELEHKVDEIKRKKAEKEREEQEAARRRAEYEGPLTKTIAQVNINTLGNLYGKVKNWKKYNKRETLSEPELTVFKEKIKEIYSSLKPREQRMKHLGKELNTLIGPDLAQQWAREILKR